MARLKAAPVKVTKKQRETLEAIVRKRSSAQQLVTRSRIILLAGAGVGVRATVRELGIGREAVQRWRRRWEELSEVADVVMRLSDIPRPGAPAVYSAEQVCEIMALACELPESRGLAMTHWTQQALADEAVKQGIVESISQRSVGRFLKRSGLEAASNARLAEHN